MINKIKKYIEVKKSLNEILSKQELNDLYNTFSFLIWEDVECNFEQVIDIRITADKDLIIEDINTDYSIPLAFIEDPVTYLKENLSEEELQERINYLKEKAIKISEEYRFILKSLAQAESIFKAY